MSASYDAVVVGSGPNGLTAAATLATSGWRVLVLEAAATIGGGTRTQELTEPGFRHDVCSAIHPFGAASPAFATLDLARHGLRWIQPEIALAHPLGGERAAVLDPSWAATTESLGEDGRRWQRRFRPFVDHFDALASEVMRPIVHLPRHPIVLARFGLPALTSARRFVRGFKGDAAPALFAGLAAHSMLSLDHLLTASLGLSLGAAGHAVGWPVAAGGSQAISDALASVVVANGGEIETGVTVKTWADIPTARAVLFDTSPRQLAAIAADRLPARYRRRLDAFRHGPASVKVDYALDAPVPWTAAACRRAGTVHVGGPYPDVAASEHAMVNGSLSERPFVLVGQQSLIDPTRAPAGAHTLWAYCHVPRGSDESVTPIAVERIEAQIERFAPGFRDVVRARHVMGPAAIEAYNANYVDGDIAGGSLDGLQLLVRPVASTNSYRTPTRGVYLCSASTPPGAGAHGMCGWGAARLVLRDSAGGRHRI